MSENAITRRGFLAGSAGVVAVAAASGYVGFTPWEQAYAADGKDDQGRQTSAGHTTCAACSAKCGFTAYTADGRLTKLIGDSSHPRSRGALCAAGYGFSQVAYSPDRLTDPLKKADNGSFVTITWEQAYSEIAEKINNVGAQSLAYIHDSNPSAAYYGSRFMAALGSANTYVDAGLKSVSSAGALMQTIGAPAYVSDIAQAKAMVLIGGGYDDALPPSFIKELESARENGCYIALVGPRYNTAAKLADEWLPAAPGSELAVLLALAHVIIKEARYDLAFVNEHTVGFSDFAAAVASTSPEWAEARTQVPARAIYDVARRLGDAAPAASLSLGWEAASGYAYTNSGELARAAALVNTLLGNWNQPGGAIITPAFAAGTLDSPAIKEVSKPSALAAGLEDFPLAPADMAPGALAVKLAHDGKIKGIIASGANLVADVPDSAYVQEALAACSLVVVIDTEMTETAELADYVLPDTSYLERTEVPEFIPGKTPCIALRSQVIDRIYPNTKPIDEIFVGLADAAGVDEYFTFSVEDLGRAQSESVGADYDALKRTGSFAVGEKPSASDSAPLFATSDEKIHFTDETIASAAAGLSAVPAFVEMPAAYGAYEFHMIVGDQALHRSTVTSNVEDLAQLSKDYGLDRVWMHPDAAKEAGINDGDRIELNTSRGTAEARVRLTKRIEPGSVFVPSHYGATAAKESQAKDFGVRPASLIAFDLEPGYGSPVVQESIVTVKKVGA